MITQEQFCEEFAGLAWRAGIEDTCAIELSERMSKIHRCNYRRYAEVKPWELHFHFAPEVLSLPRAHRRGLIMHELGHVLCRELPDGGTEQDADDAAAEVFGERIEYDHDWPGKGLQRVGNPPYQGMPKDWTRKPLPRDLDKIKYRTKTDMLNVFLDHNRRLVDDYGGEDMVHSRASFDAINNAFDIPEHREVDTIAKAVWWVAPTGPGPWHLDEIDVSMLNRTAPAIYNPKGRVFMLPDAVEEARLLEQESAWWAEREWPEG